MINVYIINGISEFKKKLGNENKSLLEKFLKLIKNSNNTIAIVIDNYDGYKELQLEIWFKEIFNKNRGIWLGGGIGNQILLNTSNINPELRNANYSDMAFIVNDGNVIPIKKVVVEHVEANDEK